MNMFDAALELRSVVAKILNDLMAGNAQAQNKKVNNILLGEKIGQLIECNLLTYQEIDSLFGWSGDASRFHRYFLEPHTNAAARQLPDYEILNRVSALIGVVAAKYRLVTTFATKDQVLLVAQKLEKPEEESTVAPTLPMIPPFEKTLEELQFFDHLTVRVCNAIKDERIVTVGELLVATDAQFLRINNFGRRSLDQLNLALGKLYGTKLGMITKERLDEYMSNIPGA